MIIQVEILIILIRKNMVENVSMMVEKLQDMMIKVEQYLNIQHIMGI
jgi:hypothetical protein